MDRERGYTDGWLCGGGGCMMDTIDIAVFVALISPVYIALFGIYQKIGRYDEVCLQFIHHMEKEQCLTTRN